MHLLINQRECSFNDENTVPKCHALKTKFTHSDSPQIYVAQSFSMLFTEFMIR